MTWRSRAVRLLILSPLLVFVGAIVFYPCFIFWDIHRVRQVCAVLTPGSPVADIRRIVTHYSLGQYLLGDDGLFDEKTKTWNIFIPAGTTLGDVTCAIEHNRKVVVRTLVLGD
jgi:hypothetical protein